MANLQSDKSLLPELRLPCFFFSYARKDRDRYLEKFFGDLCQRVAMKGALDYEKGEVSFRDLPNIEPGSDWENTLAEALRVSRVLICIYTPWYFSRPYCGKELKVFIDRQSYVTYQDGQVRNSQKILPVLWLARKDLERLKLPPKVIRYIQQFDPGQLNLELEGIGLRRILEKQGTRGLYREILERLADRLLDLATNNHLEPSPQPPKLSEIENIFERDTSNNSASKLVMGPRALLLLYLSDQRQTQISRALTWRPFSSRPEEIITDLVGYLASFHQFQCQMLSLDSSNADAANHIINAFQEATTHNAIPIVILDPRSIQTPQLALFLEALVKQSDWRGGVIIPLDNEDQGGMQLLPALRSTLEPIIGLCINNGKSDALGLYSEA